MVIWNTAAAPRPAFAAMSRSAPRIIRIARLLLLALAPAPAAAQPLGRAPRVAVTVGGVGAGRVATGAISDFTPADGARTRDLTVHRSADLRLDGRSVVALEGAVPIGRRGWAAVADVGRSVGRGTLVQREAIATGGDLETLREDQSTYARVVAWTGSVGVARAVALGGTWAADLRASALLGRVRAPGDGPCPPVPPSQGVVGPCLRRPALALTTPGARLGAGLHTPPWHGVRGRVLVSSDVLWTTAAGLVAEGAASGVPAGGSRRRTGRTVRAFPTAGLGLAVALPR